MQKKVREDLRGRQESESESKTKREMYLSRLTKWRARPLGEVVKKYISLKTGRFGFDFREAFPYADQCAATVLTEVFSQRMRPGATRQSLSRVRVAPLYALESFWPQGLHLRHQGLLLSSTSAGSPLRFSRAPWLLGSRLSGFVRYEVSNPRPS